MVDLVKVEVKNLFRTDNSGGGVFLGNEEKTFAIFIGPAELNALILAGGGIPTPRPLTHNLLDMILSGFKIDVRSVVITDLVENAFHARLTLGQGGHEVEIDCRPSDALVVAMLRKKEVFVTRKLFDKVEDGELLLSAMRKEIQKSKAEDEGVPDEESEDLAGDEGEEDEAPRGRSKGEPGKKKASKGGSPEGKLGDVRDIPGIDWSGFDLGGKK